MTQVLEIRLESASQLAAGARSTMYALVAEALSFPDAEAAARLKGGGWLRDLEEAFALLPFTFEVEPDLRCIPGRKQLEHDYIRLFEVGPGGPYCALYEGSHRGGRMKIMEELVRFYEHFGLKTVPGDHPDHVCAELQFMHFLTFKQAAARQPEAGPALATAQKDFLYRHLCKWLPRVVARLEGARDPSRFYSAVAGLASAYCAADVGWLRKCRGNSDHQIGPLPD